MDINEFRTTWNNELFQKNKSAVVAAKRLIRKSIVIAQIRSCRQWKATENDLTKKLQDVQYEQQILKSSLAENLEERLKILQNEIKNYNNQIKDLVQQEKDYWKQIEQTIIKRANFHKLPTNKLTPSSNTRPLVLTNATYVINIDKNNENLPPVDYSSPVKIPRIRKKKACIS